MIHAARPGRLHAAVIDFKQAYDTIPRAALWQHLERISMPTHDAYMSAGCREKHV